MLSADGKTGGKASPQKKHSVNQKARQEKAWIFPVALLFCALIALAGAAWIGLQYLPAKYSDEEVDEYVRTFYGESWTLQKKRESSDPEEGITGYLYAGKGGRDGKKNVTFSVFATAVPERAEDLLTGRSRKALYDNYISKVIDSHREELEDLAEDADREGGPKLEIRETGEAAGAFGAQYSFCLYLEGSRQIEEAAALIAQMDELLSLACGRGSGEWEKARPRIPAVQVYMKPVGSVTGGADAVTGAAKRGTAAVKKAGGESAAGESAATEKAGGESAPGESAAAEKAGGESAAGLAGAGSLRGIPVELSVDWRSEEVRGQYLISEIGLTSFQEKESGSCARLRREDVAARLENDYVDAAKTFGRDYYSISEELAARYPAPVLTLVNIGGYDLRGSGAGRSAGEADPAASLPRSGWTYSFVYHRGTGTYWLTGLDPCEDFDGNPFGDYPRRGAFANLVKCLGGTFTPGEWAGSWRIGQTTWKASVQTQRTGKSSCSYQSMHLTCDGNIILLDQVPDLFAAAGALPSGRPFSIQDLIRMLHVRITINQKEMTAVMFRDFETE